VVERSAGGWVALHDPTLGKTGTNGVVNAIEVNPANSDIYIGGAFTSPANNIAMWSSGSWLAVGSGVINGAVYALDYWGGSLYIGGDFTNAGGLGADHLARLNSSNLWTAVGGSVDDSVRALADNGAELLVGGYFRNVNGGTLPMYQVVRWTGSKWIALGSGMMGEYGVPRTVNAIVINGPYVYLGGNFRGAGPYISDNIAIWGGYARFMPLIKR
jgi:hypothetical protein